MPLTHWACPEDKPTFGEIHSPDYCILECADPCMAPGLVAAMTDAVRRNYHKGQYISATTLSGCVRSLKLERTLAYADIMQHQYYAYRGELLHRIAEDSAQYEFEDGTTLEDLGYLSENKMALGFCFDHHGFVLPEHVDPWDPETWEDVTCPECKRQRRPFKDRHWFILGGTLDSFEPLWGEFDEETGTLWGILWDYKTMAQYALQLFITGQKEKDVEFHTNIKDSHFLQANVYCYLFENAPPPKGLQEKGVKRIRLKKADIQGIGMNDFPRSGSTYRFKKHWKQEALDWEIPSIDFLLEEEIEEIISESAWDVYQALIKNEIRGPICEPNSTRSGEHSWECRFCPFQHTEHCPDPGVEWSALQDGASEEEAFEEALGAFDSKAA